MTTRNLLRALLLVGLLVLCVSLVFAQGEDAMDLAREYKNTPLSGVSVLMTIVWSGAYLLIYAAVLGGTLAYLQLFPGFDAAMILWMLILWLGGMVANFIGYAISDNHFLASLIALPLIFGWSMLVGTRSFADMLPRDALRISIIIAVLCTPYFGPTWQAKPPQPVRNENIPPPVDEQGCLPDGAFPLAGARRGGVLTISTDRNYQWNTQHPLVHS